MKSERARKRSEKRQLNNRTGVNYESLMDGKDSCYVATVLLEGKPREIVLQTREHIYSKGSKMKTIYQGFLPNGESIRVGGELVNRKIKQNRLFRF